MTMDEIRAALEAQLRFNDQIQSRVDQLGEKVDQLGQKVDQLGDKVDQLGTRIDQVNERVDKLAAESEKWDERFFQLSKDSINFARTVIITAAVVAVITPFLREGLEFTADTFLRR
ncbi:MAG: hypothetical protein Q6M04_05065 [Thermostichus sp. BF3_bins_97]